MKSVILREAGLLGFRRDGGPNWDRIGALETTGEIEQDLIGVNIHGRPGMTRPGHFPYRLGDADGCLWD